MIKHYYVRCQNSSRIKFWIPSSWFRIQMITAQEVKRWRGTLTLTYKTRWYSGLVMWLLKQRIMRSSPDSRSWSFWNSCAKKHYYIYHELSRERNTVRKNLQISKFNTGSSWELPPTTTTLLYFERIPVFITDDDGDHDNDDTCRNPFN